MTRAVDRVRVRFALLVLSAVVVLGVTYPPAAAERPGGSETVKHSVAFDRAAAERRVEIDNVTGSIRVRGDATVARAELSATRTTRADSADRRAAAQRDVRLDVIEGATIVFRVEGPFRQSERRGSRWTDPGYEVRYDFDLRVPPQTSVKLMTVNEGDITVEGVSGRFDVHHVNGGITLTDVAGSGVAETVNGAVEARFAAAPTGPWQFKTVNGHLVTWFPATLAAEVRVKTLNGDVYSDFDVIARPATSTRDARRNGMRRVRLEPVMRLRVGAGGPELAFETLNGDVQLRQAAR